MEKSIAIVGSGLAGLTASVYLARAGFKVTIYEKASHIGGRGITNIFGDIHFNLGPHALYPAARTVLKELGIPFSGGNPVGYYATYKDILSIYPASTGSLFKTKLFGLGAKLELAQFFSKVNKIEAKNYQNVTVKDWLTQNVRHQAIKDFVESALRVGTYANAPEMLSAGFAIENLKSVVKHGVFYVDGGWQTLVNGLEKAAKEANVAIVTSCAVEAVERDGTIKLANGNTVQADKVIICAAPQIAAQLIENGTNPQLKKWAQEAVPVRAATLDVALSRLPVPERKAAFGIDEPLYLSVHSNVSKLAPAGIEVIHVAKYLHPNDKNDAHAVEKELENFFERVHPGWRDYVVERRYLPNMLVSNALVLAKNGGTQARPGVKLPGFSNIFLAGDWVGAKGNLAEAVFISARAAAQQIIQEAGNREQGSALVAVRSQVMGVK
jgi:phytoene dehydrogenase-like protein